MDHEPTNLKILIQIVLNRGEMNVGRLTFCASRLSLWDATRGMSTTELALLRNSSSVAAAALSQQQLRRSSSSIVADATSFVRYNKGLERTGRHQTCGEKTTVF